LAGTDLTSFLVDNGGQMLLDVLGVDDVENCFTKGDVMSCIWALIDVIPPTKLVKLADFLAKVLELAPKIVKFIEELEKAKQLLKKMDELLEQLRKLRDQAALANTVENAACAARDPKGSGTNGTGNIQYWPMQPFGDGTDCRATGSNGVFDNTMKAAKSPADPRYAPAGFNGQNPLADTRGHLIGKQFGGSAKNPRNFVAMGHELNNENMSVVENVIAARIAAAANGQTVEYDVIPLYPDAATPIPSAVHLVAVGAGLNINCTLTNELVPQESGTCG